MSNPECSGPTCYWDELSGPNIFKVHKEPCPLALPSQKEFHDFEIEYAGDPASLDKTLQQLGACVLLGAPDFVKRNGHYVMRVLGNPGYIKFAVEHQGYCKILSEVPREI